MLLPLDVGDIAPGGQAAKRTVVLQRADLSVHSDVRSMAWARRSPSALRRCSLSEIESLCSLHSEQCRILVPHGRRGQGSPIAGSGAGVDNAEVVPRDLAPRCASQAVAQGSQDRSTPDPGAESVHLRYRRRDFGTPIRIPFPLPGDFLVLSRSPANEKIAQRSLFGSWSWNRFFTAPRRPPLPVFFATP